MNEQDLPLYITSSTGYVPSRLVIGLVGLLQTVRSQGSIKVKVFKSILKVPMGELTCRFL